MAPRKATKKRSGKQADPKSMVSASKFPADLLPPELIHLVFTHLKPTEAAAFRWAGRIVAEIGLEYLAPTVYLALKEESYDRLLAISEHPTVSKYVVRFVYETEGLRYGDRGMFTAAVQTSRAIPLRLDSPRPDSSASARAWRAYERELVREKPLLSQEQMAQLLDRAWSMYEEYIINQKKVQQAKFFREKTAKAMKQFQNLKSMFASADGAFERYSTELTELLPNYYLSDWAAYGDMSSFDPTISVLLAAESAGLRVKNFCYQPFDWNIFAQNDKDLAALNRSMLHVRHIDMAFTIQRDSGQHRMISDIQFIRRECLDNGRVQTFLTSAPDLEYLGLAFKTRPQIYPTVNQILGKVHWSSLKAVSLDGIATHERDLLNFFGRHSYTLKDLSLSGMVLYEVSWWVVFHGVRRAFRLGQQLHTCKLGGWFSHAPPYKKYNMQSEGLGRSSLGILVSDYVRATDVGDVSLREYQEAKRPQLLV